MRDRLRLKMLAVALNLMLFAQACVAGGGTTAEQSIGAKSPSASHDASAGDMDALIAAAKAEGALTTIALAHDVCNYGEMIESFSSKYGIAINELDPTAGSGDEIQAIRANKGNPGPQAPDVIDVGPAFAKTAKDEGLIQPYKVAVWDTIPDHTKDAEGYWYADYYGVLSFEVNKSVVPTVPLDWPDLLKAEHQDRVALPGDPRVSNQAIQSIYASALANGGSLDDAGPGLDFWKRLVDAGNFVPVIARSDTIAQGETPITIRWTYNALSNRDALAGNPEIEVVVPASARFGGFYVQAISAYAPHPNAAKLWMEHLYSDEGQQVFLKGYCHPIRFDSLVAEDKVSKEQLDKLPDVEGAVFPTLGQLDAATKHIAENWDSVVGVDIVDSQ